MKKLEIAVYVLYLTQNNISEPEKIKSLFDSVKNDLMGPGLESIRNSDAYNIFKKFLKILHYARILTNTSLKSLIKFANEMTLKLSILERLSLVCKACSEHQYQLIRGQFETNQVFNIYGAQLKLIAHGLAGTVIDQIDSELHVTIGQIRRYLHDKFNVTQVRLYFRGQFLDDDNQTLQDYGWTSDFDGTISVQIVGGTNTPTVTLATTTGNTPRTYTPTASAANIRSNSQADQ